MTDATTTKTDTPTQDSALMAILRGTDEAAKMTALEGFTLQPCIPAGGDGDYSDYSTEVAPDSYDELRDAVGLGLITMAQIEALRQVWYDRSLGQAAAPASKDTSAA